MTRIASTFASLTLLFALGCATADDFGQDPVGQDSAEASVRGSFDLWRSDSGAYYFHLAAANHEVLLASQAYDSRTGALTGVLSVLANASNSARYDLFQGRDGQYYFNLRAANGKIIGSSEGYVTRQGAEVGVNAVMATVAGYVEHWENNSGARFEVFEATRDQFFFDVYAANGEIVLASESYTSHAAALNGAFSVLENGQDRDSYEILESADGQFYFNLRAANGEIIGTSELYVTRYNAERGIADTMAVLAIAELL